MHVYIHEINNYHNYYNISIYTAISCVYVKQSLVHPEFLGYPFINFNRNVHSNTIVKTDVVIKKIVINLCFAHQNNLYVINKIMRTLSVSNYLFLIFYSFHPRKCTV